MYPKVKVREQEDYDDQYEFETRSLQSLKTPECFSLNDFSSPDNSPTSVVRVPRFDSSTSGAISNRKQKLLEENKTNIRASPIPRPRAVLSSPGTSFLNFSQSQCWKAGEICFIYIQRGLLNPKKLYKTILCSELCLKGGPPEKCILLSGE
nr:uncharacterized protein LOC113737105 isoform X2 [Coffea arabica]